MTPASPSDFSLEVRFDDFARSIANADFKGSGRLTISGDGSRFTFAGRRRGWFAQGPGELTLRAEDVTNVDVADNVVRFKTPKGKSAARRQPFAFLVADAATAQELAALLPDTKDAAHLETADFAARLAAANGPQSGVPSATTFIVAANVVVFVIMGLLGAGWFDVASMEPYIRYGANNGAATTDGEWWRLITSMFMHYGLLHLALNMWALYQAGRLLEKLLGRSAYLLTYFASGIAGGFASIGWHGDGSWSAGASGAVFGVFGAIFGYTVRQRQGIPKSVFRAMLKSTLIFVGYNVLYGAANAGIDNAAHLGGLAGGAVFGALLALPLDRAVRLRESGRRVKLGLAALAVLAAIGVAATPRYDYRVSDAFAWAEITGDFVAREDKLLPQQHARMERLIAGGNEAAAETEVADWIETQMVSLYQEWGYAIESLELSDGRPHARYRDELLRVFELKLANYRQLAAGLRAHDAAAVQRYAEAEKAVTVLLTQMQSGEDAE